MFVGRISEPFGGKISEGRISEPDGISFMVACSVAFFETGEDCKLVSTHPVGMWS
jgi:hypothetical protein